MSSTQVSDFDIARLQFDLFIEQRNFTFLDFRRNHKNHKQFIGVCCDSEIGREDYYLISQSGRYYRYDPETRKWPEVPYVLKEGE